MRIHLRKRRRKRRGEEKEVKVERRAGREGDFGLVWKWELVKLAI